MVQHLTAFQTSSLIGVDYEGISEAHNMVVVIAKMRGEEQRALALEPLPVPHDAERETLANIDRRLHHIINTLGWPTWNTAQDRSGGQVPTRTEHYFGQHALDRGARIDMHRGIVSDDFS